MNRQKCSKYYWWEVQPSMTVVACVHTSLPLLHLFPPSPSAILPPLPFLLPFLLSFSPSFSPPLPSLLSLLSFFFFSPGPKVSSLWLRSCSSTTSSSLSPTSPGECSRTRHSTLSSMTCLPLSSRCQPCIASAASEMVSRLSTYTLCRWQWLVIEDHCVNTCPTWVNSYLSKLKWLHLR